MVELVSILLLAFMMRFVFLSGYTTDDMTHLAFVRLRSRKDNFFDNDPPDSVMRGHFGYPMLAHWIISRFPQRRWKAVGKLLNIAYDLVLIAATWGVARLWLPETSQLPVSPAALAALAVTTSPCLLPITARIKSLGARSLGNILLMGLFLALWLGMQQPLVFGPVAVVLTILILTTSQFGIQAMMLSAPFLSLFTLSMLPLGVALCTLLVLLALYRCDWMICKGIQDNVRHMLEHKRWYCRNAQKGTTAMGRNSLRDLLELPSWWKKNKDIFFGILFRRNSYLIALYSFPLFWVAVYAFMHPVSTAASSFEHFSLAVVFSLACVFLLTSTKKLSFLGQAERYFEYATPFGALVLASQFASGSIQFGPAMLLILLQGVFTLCNLAYTNFAVIKKALVPEADDEIVKYLDEHEGLRILTIPMKLSTYYSYASTADHAYYFKLTMHEKHGMKHRDAEMPWLELPCQDLAVFTERYGVDTIIVDKAFLKKALAENAIEYDFSDWEPVFDSNSYTIYSKPKDDLQ